MNRHGVIHYTEDDIRYIAIGNHMKESDVYEMYRTGCCWKLYERAFIRMFPAGKVVVNGKGYDLILNDQRFEIRCLNGYVQFSQSSNTGKGRDFSEKSLRTKMEEIVGYIIIDVLSFPHVDWWYIMVDEIKELRKEKLISKKTAADRCRFYRALEYLTADEYDADDYI